MRRFLKLDRYQNLELAARHGGPKARKNTRVLEENQQELQLEQPLWAGLGRPVLEARAEGSPWHRWAGIGGGVCLQRRLASFEGTAVCWVLRLEKKC